MNKLVYNKLVRDKIPVIIKQAGKKATIDILSDKEYIKKLDEKLIEEFEEYQQSKEIEELADIVEVIYAILAVKGVSIQEFEKIRKEKEYKRGAFKEKILLKEVIEE